MKYTNVQAFKIKLNPDEYYRHPNKEVTKKLWKSERCVEIELGRRYLEFIRNRDKSEGWNPNIVEVGAVMQQYGYEKKHLIIDPFDPYTIKYCREFLSETGRTAKTRFMQYGLVIDAEDYNYYGKDVLSLSTIEHFGTTDYGNRVIENNKPIRFIDKILSESNTCFLSIPILFNSYLDKEIPKLLTLINELPHIGWFMYEKIDATPTWRFVDEDPKFEFLHEYKQKSDSLTTIFIHKNISSK